jgi:hypothetical protein
VVGPTTELEVFGSRTAEEFYASFGFVPIRHVDIPVSEDCMFPVILMRRKP